MQGKPDDIALLGARVAREVNEMLEAYVNVTFERGYSALSSAVAARAFGILCERMRGEREGTTPLAGVPEETLVEEISDEVVKQWMSVVRDRRTATN